MPNNRKYTKYVIGFHNSEYISHDSQWHLWDTPETFFCSKDKGLQVEYSLFMDAVVVLNAIKAKMTDDIVFVSIDDENLENVSKENIYHEKTNEEECYLGINYLILNLSAKDLKIFSREVSIIYNEVE